MSQENDDPEQVPVTEASATGTQDVPATVEFAQFYSVYQPKLLAFVQRTARTDDLPEAKLDAEGVVHDTFEQALRAWHTIDHPERWIFRVAARQLRRHSRREWFQERDLHRHLRTMHSTESGPDPVHTQALADAVIDQIMTLPTNQRIATYLHHVEQWTGTEIAELLGIRPGTVGTHIHRGTAEARVVVRDNSNVYQCRGAQTVRHGDIARSSGGIGCGVVLFLLLVAGLVALTVLLRPSLIPWAIGGAVVGVVAFSCVTWAVPWLARKVRRRR